MGDSETKRKQRGPHVSRKEIGTEAIESKQNKITNIDNIAEDGNAETPTTRLMIMAFKPALEDRLASSDLQAHIASKGRELTGTAQGFGDEGA